MTEAYNLATIEYSELVGRLDNSLRKIAKEDRDALKEAVRLAREKCDESRAALERHLKEHQCASGRNA